MKMLWRIRHIRQQKNYTEKAIAEALLLTQPAYHQKENGAISFKAEELFRLAAYYKICIMDFFRDQLTDPEFADYAASQGYVHSKSYLKEIETLRQQIKKPYTERIKTEETLAKLEQDKKFLREMLNNLYHSKKDNA